MTNYINTNDAEWQARGERPTLTPEEEEEFKAKIAERFWSLPTQKYIKEMVGNTKGEIQRRNKVMYAAREDMAGSNLLENTNYSNYAPRAMQWLEDLVCEWLKQNPEPSEDQQ